MTCTESPGLTKVSSVSFGFAATQTWLVDTRPKAPVLAARYWAGLQAVHTGNHAIHRRRHRGVIQLPLGLVHPGLRQAVGGQAHKVRIGVAAQARQLHLGGGFGRLVGLLIDLELIAGIVIGLPRDVAPMHQAVGAVEAGLVHRHLRPLGRHVAQHAFIVVPHRLELQARLGQVGLRAGEGDPELPVIQPEQDVAAVDLLALMHPHLGHDPGHVGGYDQLVGADVGIVDGDVSPAVQPEEQRREGYPEDTAHHQHEPNGSPAPGARRPGPAQTAPAGPAPSRSLATSGSLIQFRTPAERGPHVHEALRDGVQGFAVQPRGQLIDQRIPLMRQLGQHGLSIRQQVQAPDAAIRGIRPALHQAARLQPVHQAGHRDRLHF